MKNKKVSLKAMTRKLDKIFSEIVRARGYCVRCGGKDSLQCCHIFSRNNRSVRWDFNNVVCMDAKCHFWGHQNPILFTEFVKKFMGDNKYEELKIRANQIKKWTVWDMEELYKSFIEILEAK